MGPKQSADKVKKPTKGKKGGNPVSGSLKDVEQRRRQVFKPVLDNPYTQSNLWPFIEPSDAETIIEHLCHILSKYGQYNDLIEKSKSSKNFVKPEAPEISKHLTIGFNSTVKALERQAQGTRDKLAGNNNVPKEENIEEDDNVYIKYVFITKFEISPKVLLEPFPVLTRVASRNREDQVKLVQLPRGSSKRLSEVLNVSNVTIVGLSNEFTEASGIYDLINSKVKDVEVPWIEKMLEDGFKADFSKPVLKVLSTTAPIFPKKNDQKKKKTPPQKADG
ncbi:hypothetical protein CLIB1423_09S05006 [[Candida] railenensis]|uniref:Uncharacterized protein n=1 Tax=[Candida] railenensis TaxID=45579 RepID=A0A9P0VYN8_9ASCO|nr:hypothetical protein CLIB1423_09S05006 [[Candida] railenensis]